MKYEVNKKHTAGIAQVEPILKEPPLYQVVLHNDDFTPMEFVMGILEKFFFFRRRVAAEITLTAHADGKAVFGNFSRDYAETKISQVIDYARLHEHPLVCSMEVAT
jgi:ATP-dependent Clp protease adaptor protein ClpS